MSAFPPDGTWPSGTSQFEKRALALEIPIWQPDVCVQCNFCSMICPHAAIQTKVFDPAQLANAPAQLPLGAGGLRAGARGAALRRAGRARGLHRLRALHRGVPGEGPAAAAAQGAGLGAARRPSRGRARGVRVLPDPRVGAADRAADRQAHGRASAAAVRVLGRLRRLRRDAVPAPAHAALRRSPPDRQRHRLLVDLRRQPADDAVHEEHATGAARPGPTRSSRTTRSSASACASRSTCGAERARAGCCARWPRGFPRRSSRRCSKTGAGEAWLAAQRERVAELDALLARDGSPEARALARASAGARPAQRVDRRRRRLGLRHRLRRPRPRARLAQEGERPRPRHRGLLEHRRSAVEGHAARRRRQVRDRRQGDAQEGPRPARDELRPRLRRRGRDAGAQRADGGGLPRSRASSRALARSSPTARASRTATTWCTRRRSRSGRSRAACGRSIASIPSRVERGEAPLVLDSGPAKLDVAAYMENEARFRMVELRSPERYAMLRRRGARRGSSSGARSTSSSRGSTCRRRRPMADLSTTWLGLPLRSPLVVAASPLSQGPGRDRGARWPRAPAPSSCIRSSRSSSSTSRWRRIASSTRESTWTPRPSSVLPDVRCLLARCRAVPRRARAAATGASTCPIVASLNGTTPGGWTSYAQAARGRGRRARSSSISTRSRRRPTRAGAAVEQRQLEVVAGGRRDRERAR